MIHTFNRESYITQ